MEYASLIRNLKILGLASIILSVILAIVIIVSAITNESAELGLLVGSGLLLVGIFIGAVEIALGSIIEINCKKNVESQQNKI